jgi:hypothetical protein
MLYSRLSTIILLLFLQQLVFAQTGNVVVFSENSDRFYLFVNGLQQNMTPQPNVKITNLPESQYKIKVVFEDNTLTQLERLAYIDAGQEYSYNIKRDKKGILKMTPFSMTEINNAVLPGQFVVVYGSATNNQVVQTIQNNQTNNTNTVQQNSNVGANSTNQNMNGTVNANVNVNSTQNQTNNSTNVNTNMGTDNVGFNMNISVSENGFNMNVNESGNPANNLNNSANFNNSGNVNSNSNYQQTTTVTTTQTVNGQVVQNSTSTQVNGQPSNNNANIQGQYNNQNNTNFQNNTQNNTNFQNNTQQNTTTYQQINTGACFAMADADFNSLRASVKSKSFEDSKLTTAKQALKSNCLNTRQIKDIMQTFSFEASKLDFAKIAYSRCTDQNNYFSINDMFTFESSIDELNDYINK